MADKNVVVHKPSKRARPGRLGGLLLQKPGALPIPGVCFRGMSEDPKLIHASRIAFEGNSVWFRPSLQKPTEKEMNAWIPRNAEEASERGPRNRLLLMWSETSSGVFDLSQVKPKPALVRLGGAFYGHSEARQSAVPQMAGLW